MKKNRTTRILAYQNNPGQEILKGKLKYPCPHCGSLEPPRIGAGRKPREASLHCAGCKRFQRWIAADELKGKGGEA